MKMAQPVREASTRIFHGGNVGHDVTQNEEKSRFEMKAGDGLAVAAYRREGNAIVFTHTEVPESAEGQGLGGRLAKAALEQARKDNLQVVPRCSFIASYIARHDEYRDLVPEEHRHLIRQ
jgi:predicted GNAT family acetyltransferase